MDALTSPVYFPRIPFSSAQGRLLMVTLVVDVVVAGGGDDFLCFWLLLALVVVVGAELSVSVPEKCTLRVSEE